MKFSREINYTNEKIIAKTYYNNNYDYEKIAYHKSQFTKRLTLTKFKVYDFKGDCKY